MGSDKRHVVRRDLLAQHLAAEYVECQNFYNNNPDKYPLTIENWFQEWSDENTNLVFCFPFATGWSFRFPISTYNFYEALDAACGDSACLCPGYYSNIFDVQGNFWADLTNTTVALLVNALKVFGYFFGLPFRLTNTSQFWQAITWRMEGIWPAWVLDLFGSQGEPGSEIVLFMCAATKGFGPFLHIWFLILLIWIVMSSFGLFIVCAVVLGIEYILFLFVLGLVFPTLNTVERRTARKQSLLAMYRRFLRRPREIILPPPPPLPAFA